MLSLQAMAKRGKTILYDQIPDDAFDKIIEIQAHLKKKSKVGRVSLSTAITKLIRAANVK